MKKFLAWVETEYSYETWLLIDSPSESRAKEIASGIEGFIELRACKEVKPNDAEGVSHTFTLLGN